MKVSNSKHNRKTAKRVMAKRPTPRTKLQRENADLRARLAEADETLRAIRSGDVDALVVARAILDNAAEAIIVCDNQQLIIHANEAAHDLCGDSPLGKSFEAAFPLYATNGEPFHVSAEFCRARWQGIEARFKQGGRVFELLFSVGPLRGKQDEQLGCVITLTDITQRKMAEDAPQASQQWYATTLASIGDAVIATDTAGNITFMNPVAEKLTGWTLADAFQQPATNVINIVNEETLQKIENPIEKVLEQRQIVSLTSHTDLVRADGTLVAIDDSGAPIKDEKGNTIGVVFVFRDITERKQGEAELAKYRNHLEELVQQRTSELQAEISNRKQAEQALTSALQRLEAHVDNSPMAVVEFDPEFHVTHWSRGAERMFSWTADEVLNKRIADLRWVHEDDAERVASLSMDMFTGRSRRNLYTNRNYRKDGSVIECEWYNSALRDSDGKLISVRSQVLDVTERKELENALRASEEKAQKLIKYAPVGIYEIDSFGRQLISFNEVVCEWTGYTREELLAMNPMDLIGETNRAKFQERIKKKLNGEDISDSVEYPIITKDHRELILEVHVGGVTYQNSVPQNVLVVAHNVTERKKIEDSLRQLSYAVEQSPTSIVVTDTAGAIQYVNPKFCELTGYTLDEVLGQNPRILQSGQTPRHVYEQMWSKLTSGEEWRGEFLNQKKNGDLYWESVSIAPMTDKSGKITQYVSVKEDITERRKMEEALRESEQRFRLALAHAPVTVGAQDRDMRYIWAFNPRTAEVTHVLGKTDYDLFSPEDAERLIALKRRVFETGTPLGEQLWISRNSHRMFVDLYLEPLRDATGQVIGVGIATVDLTERKLMELQIRAQARHLAAIADLSERLAQGALDVQGIQDLVTQRVCKTIGNACFISLLSEDGRRLNPQGIYAPDLQVSPNARVELMPLSVEDELVRLVIQGQACSFEQWSVEQIHTWVKPEYWKSAERFVGSNFSIVPMRVQGRTMGVLGLVRFQSEHASFADEKSFLQDVADRTAIALVNAQLFGQIQRARDELEQRVQERTESERRQRVLAETMRDASFAFSRTLNLNTVFDELLVSVGHALSFDSAAIMLLEENSDIRVYVTSSDRIMTVSLSDGKRFDLSAFPILRQIVETKTSRCIGDVRQEAEWKQTPGSEHSVNWLGVPMVASNRIVGMFSIHKLEPGYFTADHVRLTETLASYAAASIQNAQLYNQVITSREQMETLSRELMEAEENERGAVARELHDEIGQVLIALKTNLEVHRIATDIATQEHSLEESSAIIDRVLDQVRSLSLDLRPSLLDEFGLVPALEWFLDRQAQRHGIEIILTANPLDIQPPKIATVCFRVVQAALTNVVRHAHASQVRVTVDQVPPSRSEDDAPGCIELHIADDGAGFDVEAAIDRAMHGQSMGLLGMLERVRLAGGQFKIRSTPGHGTDIHVILPMKKEES